MPSTIDLSKLVKGSGVIYTSVNHTYDKYELIIFVSKIKHIKIENGDLVITIPKVHPCYTTYSLTPAQRTEVIDFIISEQRHPGPPFSSQTDTILAKLHWL